MTRPAARRQPRLKVGVQYTTPRQRQPERAERHHHRPTASPAVRPPAPPNCRSIRARGALTMGLYADDTYRLGACHGELGRPLRLQQGLVPVLPAARRARQRHRRDVGGQRRRVSLDTFSPRVGVNYRLNAVGHARCSRRTTAATTRSWKRASSGRRCRRSPRPTSSRFDAAGNRTNFVQISSNANLRIDPDLKAAYSDQYIVQFEQELMKNLGLQVSYVAQARRGLRRLGRHRRPVRAGALRRQRRRPTRPARR